ncbi:MAG: hypothetical protein IKR60_01850 [Alphaproteobacteria bacterium]|nr:hypothetical protein [Alphaproteobacteria bacterium]
MKDLFFKKVTICGHRLNGAVVACVLSVFIVILMVYMLGKSSEQHNLTTEALDISRTIRTAFQAKPDYRGLNNAYLIEHTLLEPSLIRQNKIFSRFQSEILIGRDEQGHSAIAGDTHFVITYKNIDRRKCLTLLSSDFDATSGLNAIKLINDNTYDLTYGGELSLPVSKGKADTLCRARNTLVLIFE